MEVLKKHFLFIKEKKYGALCIAVTLVLSYGFYASHYTVHIDQLVSEYYNGTLLVNAGRWSAPLIHLLTGWMDFSPFWHTAVMALLLFAAATAWGVLFSMTSAGKISNAAFLSFGAVFVSFPVTAAQLTYPILNIALAYLLVPLALQSVLSGFAVKKGRIKKYLSALVLLIVSVDLYESFAGVFLVGVFAVLLLLYFYNGGMFSKRKDYYYFALTAAVIFAAAIVLDFILSKLISLALCGTAKYWYENPTSIAWFVSSVSAGVKRLICTLFATFVIGSASVPFLLFFLVSAVAGLIAFIVVAAKKRSALPLLFYLGLVLSVFALPLLLGRTLPFTQMQVLPVFAAFLVLLAMQFCRNKKILNIIVSCVLIVIVLNQTKQINNYAVENYERYTYETSILEDIGRDLLQYDTKNKPVAVYANDYLLPQSLRHSRQALHPVERLYRNAACAVLDRILPEGFYNRLNRNGYDSVQSAEDIASQIADSFPVYRSYIAWSEFENDFHKMMARLGYSLQPCTPEQKAKALRSDLGNDPTCRYRIIETDEYIVVRIMTVD